MRAASILGFTLSALGPIYALIVIIARLFLNTPIEGWVSLMVVPRIVSGSQMVMIGILGEYLWCNLSETRKRPRYILDQIVESGSAVPVSRVDSDLT